jgi:hypothetical protein
MSLLHHTTKYAHRTHECAQRYEVLCITSHEYLRSSRPFLPTTETYRNTHTGQKPILADRHDYHWRKYSPLPSPGLLSPTNFVYLRAVEMPRQSHYYPMGHLSTPILYQASRSTCHIVAQHHTIARLSSCSALSLQAPQLTCQAMSSQRATCTPCLIL